MPKQLFTWTNLCVIAYTILSTRWKNCKSRSTHSRQSHSCCGQRSIRRRNQPNEGTCIRLSMMLSAVCCSDGSSLAVLAPASSPRYVASPQPPLPSTSACMRYIWYNAFQYKFRFRTGDLHPHKFTFVVFMLAIQPVVLTAQTTLLDLWSDSTKNGSVFQADREIRHLIQTDQGDPFSVEAENGQSK